MLTREFSFQGLQATGWLLAWGLIVAAAAMLIVMLLRYERRLVPRPVGGALLGLRMLVLLLLAGTLLEPTVIWTQDREQTGRIRVALDLSESMGVADAHAGRGEKLRWARALDMIGNPGIDSRLDRWIQDFEAGREPQLVDEEEARDPQRRQRLEDVRRENLEGVFEEIDRLPRREIARRLLAGTTAPLLGRLEEIGDVELLVFAGKAEACASEALDRLIDQPPESLSLQVTDLTQGLAARSEASGAGEGGALLGVVLLTDGRDNSGRDPVAAASRLGALSVPVFPVVLGSKLRPADLAIASLDYPPTVFKGDTALLRATLATSGFEGQPIPVVLERPGAEPVEKTVVPAGPEATVEFELDSERLGRHEYTLRTDPQEGETRLDNNAKTFAMTVVDDRVRVLLVEGEARWEFRFLHNALERDERVEVENVLFRQPYLGVLPEPNFPRQLAFPPDGDPANSPLSETDLVIVGDVSPQELSPRGWDLIEKFVTESGGTLVLVAGKESLPRGHRSAALERLLPVLLLRPVTVSGPGGRGSPRERGFHLRLTPDGERAAMLQFDTDPVENRRVWSELPGHVWGLLGEAKAGATVLAYAQQPGQRSTLEVERRNAVIVQQPYGFGQVLWIGVDSTWRWRHRAGDRYHHRFWGQVGRWAADNKAVAGNEFVRFGPERTEIEVGEAALIRARFTRQFADRFPALEGKVEVHRLGDSASRPFARIDLVADASRPLIHEARAAALPAGEYRLRLLVEGADAGDEDVTAALYVTEKQTLELSDLSAHPDLLTQLAAVSGGRLFYPDELEHLPDLIRPSDQSTTTREEQPLWDRWYTLLLFFTLLTTEWVVRKLNGLP